MMIHFGQLLHVRKKALKPVPEEDRRIESTTREEKPMNRFNKSILAAGMVMGSATVWAADKTPTLGDVLQASDITFSGYIDTSYSYLTGNGLFTSGTPDRVYDAQHNAFSLHTIDLSAS